MLGQVQGRGYAEALGVGIADGLRDRVRRALLHMGGKAQQALGRDALDRGDRLDVKLSLRERAGLVEDDGLDPGELLEIVAAFREHASTGKAAYAAIEAQRHRDDQRAGARDDEEDAGALDEVGPYGRIGGPEHERRDDGKQKRRTYDDGRVDAGEATDECLGFCLLGSGVGHHIEYARNGGILEGPCHAYVQRVRPVDKAGEHFLAWFEKAWHRLARERRSVELTCALHDDSIERYALTGGDDDDIAHLDIFRIDALDDAGLLDVCIRRLDLDERRNRLARVIDRPVLEPLAHLVEQHDGYGFRRLANGKCRDGGHRHEELLVKQLTASDALGGTDEDGQAN